ncbi:MAG: class I adenylate-forming enzyme family protein [Acidimicrobiales bacterium]
MHRLVVLDATGGPAFVERLERAWDSGDAVFPLDPRLPAPAARRLVAAMRPDEPVDEGDALVVATSGTTGEPKGVVLTHEAVRASARATSARLEVDPTADVWLACLPLAHIGGLAVVTRTLHAGTRLVVHRRFDAHAVRRSVADDGVTLVALVPTALRRIDPSGFRRIVLGGSAPPPDQPPNVVATYGMTETGSGVVYDGVPLAGVDIRVGPGRAGPDEIFVRGPMLLRRYRDGPDPKDAEGWLGTGDLGAWDEAARRLAVFGRADDVIITGGENVWPAPVEAALSAHPKVAEVAVVGRPDPEWGQRVVAVVVPADPANPPSLDELRWLVGDRLASWAAPRELELVDALPRTSLGKVRRRQGVSKGIMTR